MGTAVIGNIVKSHVSTLINGLNWFGAPTVATADWNSGAQEAEGIGLAFQDRLWIERPAALNLRIETILGNSSVIPVNANVLFNLNDYLFDLMNEFGFFQPVENQAVIQGINLSFSAGQVMTGTFDHAVYRPSQALIDWFDTYDSMSDIPNGDGSQLAALQDGDVKIVVPDDPVSVAGGIEGIYQVNVQMPIRFDPIESNKKIVGFIPKLPVPVSITLELYHDYFVLNESRFREGNTLSDIKIWKFKVSKPKIISVNQRNPSSGQRAWSVQLQAKNMIKE